MATGAQSEKRGDATATIQLSVSCRNLTKKLFSAAVTPMCVLNLQQFASPDWREIGRTEISKNPSVHEFVQKFHVEYLFGESQKLKFDLYHAASKELRPQDLLGSAECTLGEAVARSTLERQLRQADGREAGTVTIRAQSVVDNQDEVTLHFSAMNLDNNRFFGQPNPFLAFSRVNNDGTYILVHKTEIVKSSLNPQWQPFTIPLRTLCNANPGSVVKVECWADKSKVIGKFETNLARLSQGPCKRNEYELHNAQKKDDADCGVVRLMSYQLKTVNTFTDYIKAGTQMHAVIAVDFALSNGDPRDPASLHYLDPQTPNLYARALKAVGEILQDYDSDKLFPALGFAAQVNPGAPVSDLFFLNGHPQLPYCDGIDGVLQAYYRALSSVTLSGPANLATIINHVASQASNCTKPDAQGKCRKPGDDYFILLIVTDGQINDMPFTIEAVVNASVLPLSIIIVGIGGGDFSDMMTLDGDVKRLGYNKRYVERDIVQFVSFREFIGSDLNRSQAVLAKEVLAEIPSQFLSYMNKNGVKPKPKPVVSPSAPGMVAAPASVPAAVPGPVSNSKPVPGGKPIRAPPHAKTTS